LYITFPFNQFWVIICSEAFGGKWKSWGSEAGRWSRDLEEGLLLELEFFSSKDIARVLMLYYFLVEIEGKGVK
jgi:hypothetical protein